MCFNFSNFRGRTLAAGGQALVQKRGQVSDGGIGKIFAGWGDPQSPQEKNPGSCKKNQTNQQIKQNKNPYFVASTSLNVQLNVMLALTHTWFLINHTMYDFFMSDNSDIYACIIVCFSRQIKTSIYAQPTSGTNSNRQPLTPPVNNARVNTFKLLTFLTKKMFSKCWLSDWLYKYICLQGTNWPLSHILKTIYAEGLNFMFCLVNIHTRMVQWSQKRQNSIRT